MYFVDRWKACNDVPCGGLVGVLWDLSLLPLQKAPGEKEKMMDNGLIKLITFIIMD